MKAEKKSRCKKYFFAERYRTAQYSSKHFGELVSIYSLDKRVTLAIATRIGRKYKNHISMRRFPPFYIYSLLNYMLLFYLVYLMEIHHLGRELLYVFFGRKAVGGRLISEDYGY